jgi:alpha-1,4-digalacturonate transport system permease protein
MSSVQVNDRLTVGLRTLFMGVIAVIFIIPILWIFISSLKTPNELFNWPPTLIPNEFTFQNYVTAFEKANFAVYFRNSFIVTVSATVLTLVINSMAGFALAKYRFKGRNAIFTAFIATLMIPLQVIMVPIFIVLRQFGLYDTLIGIIIPPAATPTGVFLCRQFFMTIPTELMESARIDGAGEWTIFYRVMLPLATPVLTALTIFSFTWRWNDFLWPFVVISSETKFTIQVAIANFVGQFSVDWNSLLSMNIVAMIPVLLVFLFFQRYFVKGIALSGLK